MTSSRPSVTAAEVAARRAAIALAQPTLFVVM